MNPTAFFRRHRLVEWPWIKFKIRPMLFKKSWNLFYCNVVGRPFKLACFLLNFFWKFLYGSSSLLDFCHCLEGAEEVFPEFLLCTSCNISFIVLVSVVICAWLVWNWWIESDEFLSVIENVITGKWKQRKMVKEKEGLTSDYINPKPRLVWVKYYLATARNFEIFKCESMATCLRIFGKKYHAFVV